MPHPLQLQLTEPRRMGVNVSDEMWIRILDVPLALESRTYRGPGELTFELTDDFCPWNAGTWRLTVVGRGSGVTWSRLRRARKRIWPWMCPR